MKTIVNDFYTNPLIALIYSIFGIIVGIELHFMRSFFQIPIVAHPHELLDLIVKYTQIFAFTGAGIAGFVSGHGWMVKQSFYIAIKRITYTAFQKRNSTKHKK